MTTNFDAKKIKVDMSLLNESQRFSQQIKQIEPILKASCNKGLSEAALCSIKLILQEKRNCNPHKSCNRCP